MKKIWPHILPALIFVLAAIIFTWPLLPNLSTQYPSGLPQSGGDPVMHMWTIDLLAKSLSGQSSVPPGQMIFYPAGVNFYKAYEAVLMHALAVPLALIFKNLILATNLVILFGFFSTALAAYALMFHLTRSRYASAFGGLGFGFSTFMLVRGTQHPHFLLAFGLPLLVLFTVQFIKAPTSKTAILLGLSVLITGLASWYYLVAGLIFVVLAFGLYARNLTAAPTPLLLGVSGIALAALLPALPILFSGETVTLSATRDYLDRLGTQPLSLILPHNFTAVFGQFTQKIYDGFPSVLMYGPNYFESTSYIGLPMFLVLGLLYRYRKKIPVEFAKLWIAAAAGFTTLAFGSSLQLGFLTIPMPYRWLVYYVPFSFLRSTNRFIIMTVLVTVVLGSFFLKFLPRLVPNKVALFGATAALFAVLVIERLIYPYPLYQPAIPGFYYFLAGQPGTFAIADLPISASGLSEYNLYQTVHGKPIVAGRFFYPALSAGTYDFIYANPLLRSSLCEADVPQNGIPVVPETVYPSLQQNQVRYLVVHQRFLEGLPGCREATSAIYKFFSQQQPVFQDSEVIVYEVPHS